MRPCAIAAGAVLTRMGSMVRIERGGVDELHDIASLLAEAYASAA